MEKKLYTAKQYDNLRKANTFLKKHKKEIAAIATVIGYKVYKRKRNEKKTK